MTAVAVGLSRRNGGRLAVASRSISGSATGIVIFDVVSGQELLHLPSKWGVESLAFAPHGARPRGVTAKGMLVFWDGTPWPGPITPPCVALRSSMVESLEQTNRTRP